MDDGCDAATRLTGMNAGWKRAPGPAPGGARRHPLTAASSRTWRGSKSSAAPDPPERSPPAYCRHALPVNPNRFTFIGFGLRQVSGRWTERHRLRGVAWRRGRDL